MNGILLVDKPGGWTSMDVCAKLRGVLHQRKIGHSGTLDPMATGLLVVFLGRATRGVEFAVDKNGVVTALSGNCSGRSGDERGDMRIPDGGFVVSWNEAQPCFFYRSNSFYQTLRKGDTLTLARRGSGKMTQQTVTAKFSKDSAVKEYSTDGAKWKPYTDKLLVKANGTYYFRGTDAAGNVSGVAAARITNIDNVAPAAPTVRADTTAPTNKKVTLTAAFSSDTVKKQYSMDNRSWKNCSKPVAAGKNGTYYFRGIDAAGNISKVVSIKVDNIDTAAPNAPTVTASTAAPTNRNVMLTAKFSNDSVKKQYSSDKKTWKNYTGALAVNANGTYYFRGIDAAGNISKVASIKVGNIDKVAPAAPTVKLSTAKPAAVLTVTAKFSKDSSRKEYSTDGKKWQSCTGKLTVKANGTYYFRGIDAAGNVSKVASVKVANIADTANNSWDSASELTGTVSGVLDRVVDPVDYYEVGDVAKLMMDMESGKAKVTFCGSDKKAVPTEVKCADGSVRTLSAVELTAGDRVNDNITLSDLNDAVRYLKIESAASGAANYRLAKLA